MIIIDGNEIKDKVTLHQYLKSKFDLPAYYGNNLDALWDILSMQNEKLEIVLLNKENLLSQLGDYGLALLELFHDLTIKKKNIVFRTE